MYVKKMDDRDVRIDWTSGICELTLGRAEICSGHLLSKIEDIKCAIALQVGRSVWYNS